MERIKRFDEAIKNNLIIGSSEDPRAIDYSLLCAYMESVELGNEYINFSSGIFEHELPEMLREMDENGIRTFTISTTSSGLIKILAFLDHEYWEVKGLTEIRANYKDHETGKPAMIPALLISYKY